MRRKIPFLPRKVLSRIVWKITNLAGQNWLFPMGDLFVVCQLDCFLNRAREGGTIFTQTP